MDFLSYRGVVVVVFEKAPCEADFVVFCASCFLVGGGECEGVGYDWVGGWM